MYNLTINCQQDISTLCVSTPRTMYDHRRHQIYIDMKKCNYVWPSVITVYVDVQLKASKIFQILDTLKMQ